MPTVMITLLELLAVTEVLTLVALVLSVLILI
jgi:hypothetical protein